MDRGSPVGSSRRPVFSRRVHRPQEIAAIAYQNKRVVYNILFHSTAKTLTTIAADPKHLGAQIGFFAVLHTWGQNLHFHPHLHCVVPGGGLSPDAQRWVSCRPGFFLRVLSRLFRGLFLTALKRSFDAGKLKFFGSTKTLLDRGRFSELLTKAKATEWVVYAKRPFGGPQQVLDYVGRYTHRVAISNNRLLDIENDQVRFQWKDYRHHDRVKTMTLSADEFIRRFLLHVLPPGFQRIRYYGFLGSRRRQEKLALCRRLLDMPPSMRAPTPAAEQDYRDRCEDLTGCALRQCPHCQRGHMVPVSILPRSPCASAAIIDSS
jgi:hypothetical protein